MFTLEYIRFTGAWFRTNNLQVPFTIPKVTNQESTGIYQGACWSGALMRIVAWDIETTNLSGLMGRVLCASFCKITDGKSAKPYTFRLDDAKYAGKSQIDDDKLAVAIRDELEKYNLVVGWNSRLFDAAFINARLAKVGERPFHPQFHLDLMYYAGGCSMRIGSRKLLNVQKFFSLRDAKTEISWDNWNLAAGGDKDALNEVAHHCEQDVKVLAQAYWKMLPSVANLHR